MIWRCRCDRSTSGSKVGKWSTLQLCFLSQGSSESHNVSWQWSWECRMKHQCNWRNSHNFVQWDKYYYNHHLRLYSHHHTVLWLWWFYCHIVQYMSSKTDSDQEHILTGIHIWKMLNTSSLISHTQCRVWYLLYHWESWDNHRCQYTLLFEWGTLKSQCIDIWFCQYLVEDLVNKSDKGYNYYMLYNLASIQNIFYISLFQRPHIHLGKDNWK